MSEKDRRRRHKRVPVKWKAAVVFDKQHNKPTLHTQTHDLSEGGAAIRSDHPDLTGAVITLLLANPPREGEAPKMLKVRAMVVSTVEMPDRSYRHGLSFIRAPGDGLEVLGNLLAGGEMQITAPTAAAAPAAAPAAAAPAAAPGGAGGRLAQIRAMAQQKQVEAARPDPQEALNERVEGALQRAHAFFKELVEQMNLANAPIGSRGYSLTGVPEYDAFTWKAGHADFATREVSNTKKLWERVSLSFTLSTNGGKALQFNREFPANERLRQALGECKIEYRSRDTLTEKGSLKHTTFEIPCEVKAYLELAAKYDTGKIVLRTRNVSHFGNHEHTIGPEAIDDASLDELTGFILGESPKLGPLMLRGA